MLQGQKAVACHIVAKCYDNFFNLLYSRLGQIFRMEKKQFVVVTKYVEDPKLTIF